MNNLKERTPIPHCCPNCGGDWIGDGFTTPIHCERIECPQDREADANPLPCELPASDCGPCPACAGSLNGTMRYDEYRDAVRCDACGHYQAE